VVVNVLRTLQLVADGSRPGTGRRIAELLRHRDPYVRVTAASALADSFAWVGTGADSSALVNTQLGAAAAVLAWIAIERLLTGKVTVIGAATGAVAGLATITPAAGYVEPLAALAIDPGLDASTELPGYFAKRRLASFSASFNKDAAAQFVRSESRSARKDSAGARQALEASIAAEPRFSLARLKVAELAEAAGDDAGATAQFRAILGYAPNDPITLNNLAYNLAAHQNKPEEALPFVQRAIAVLKTPQFYDTLAWIQHLLKQDAEAAANIRIARSTNSLDPDLLWHAAVIYAAVKDVPRATAELTLALKIKPELADRDDVKKLRQQLSPATK